MPGSHTDWSRTCLLNVVPARVGRAGGIAIARQLDAKGLWKLFLVLLTPEGDAIAGSNWLPVLTQGNGAGLAVTGDRQALLCVTDRESRPATFRFDVAHWYAVKWRGSRISLREVGRWKDVNIGLKLSGMQTEDGSVWVGEYYPEAYTDHLDTKLVLAKSCGQELPEPHLTDIECSGCSHPVRLGDESYVLLTARYAGVELWAIDRQLNPRKILDVATRKYNETILGPARLARCGDSLMMVWGHYRDRVGTKRPQTWEGQLYAASYSPGTQSVSDSVLVSEDSRVVAATIQAQGFGKSVEISWESRPKRGGGMRAVRVFCLAEMPCEPVALPLKGGPLFLLDERGPILKTSRGPDALSWAVPGFESATSLHHL